MPRKACKPEDIEKMKKEYFVDGDTYQEIADRYFISRKTAINYINDYPYLKRKGGRSNC